MDFDFSDDQEQLRDAVRKWVDKAYSFERRRSIEDAGGFDRSAWNELAELGLCGLYVNEEDGGMGMGPVEGMVVMEELGRGIVLEPLAQALSCGALLSGYADEQTKAKWLPKLCSGEALVVLAHQEHGKRYRLDGSGCTATATSGAYQISGAKSLVPAGDKADAFLLSAMAEGQLALFLVERQASGVQTRGYGTQDGGRAAELHLHHAPATLVSRQGLTALEHAVDIGIAALCAQAVGAMDKTLAMTAEYMNTRKQFGATLSRPCATGSGYEDASGIRPLYELLRQPQAQCTGARAPCRHGTCQVPNWPVHALRGPAGRAIARRHRRD